MRIGGIFLDWVEVLYAPHRNIEVVKVIMGMRKEEE
jgi:hypothetical protein